MQAGDGARENSPEDEGKSADGEENHAEDADWNIVVFRDPDVKLVFREVGDVAREGGRVVVHGFADQNPAMCAHHFPSTGECGSPSWSEC